MSSVLVIDDDPAICLVIQQVLQRRGFEVSTAGDGAVQGSNVSPS